MTTHDKQLLKNLFSFLHKEAQEQEKNQKGEKLKSKKDKNTFFSIIPRRRYLGKKWHAFTAWFRKKDKDDVHELREEWEIWLGVDIFHPYYKYKEAQKIVKEKFTFTTPRIFSHLRVQPEYKNKQFKITLSKKF
ncbi:MAG: hypothetical protein KKH94_09990 [Candidatus Omnitrophica bacterium]|nr:hypothetical protein [Candidatus Omnitrophota bacterium]